MMGLAEAGLWIIGSLCVGAQLYGFWAIVTDVQAARLTQEANRVILTEILACLKRKERAQYRATD